MYPKELNSFINEVDSPAEVQKILFIVPESAGDILLSTSLLKSLKMKYEPCHIYFACKKQFFDILKNNPYIYKILEYAPIMEYQLIMEGYGKWSGLFDISIMVTALTQRYTNYINNGKTQIPFSLKYSDYYKHKEE